MKDIIKVTLLCTSDVHGYYMPWDYSKDEQSNKGGLSRVSTIAKKVRAENPNTMLIDNGDLIQGNSAEYFKDSERHPGIEAINAMGYEIYNMGNHEFNFGMDYLISKVGQFQGISMMGNLYRKKYSMRFMNGIYYKNIKGIKIGFISLNTPLVRKFEAKRGNLLNFDVIDADYELKKLLEEIEPCDALIALFHMGDINENEIENTGVIDLLKKVKGAEKIDAVLAGHMHQVINKKINGTIFLEPGVHGEAISRLDLTFDISQKKKLIEITPSIIVVDSSIESDKEIEEILKPYHNHLINRANQVVGYTTEDLSVRDIVKGVPQSLISQTPVADFFLEIMRHYSKADICAMHFDNPYPKITSGEIKRKNIDNSYSYSGGEVSTFVFSGKQFRTYVEWTASFFNQSKKGDVHISFSRERTKFKYSTFDIFGNLKYKMDITKPDGNRVVELNYMDGRPIQDNDRIIVGMNKYRLDQLIATNGPLAGEKIEHLWSSISDPTLGVKGTVRNLAKKYLSELPDLTYVPKHQKNWEIITDSSNIDEINIARELVNYDLLNLYRKSDGSINLNKSLNLYDEINEDDFYLLKERFGLSTDSMILIDLIKEIGENYEV